MDQKAAPLWPLTGHPVTGVCPAIHCQKLLLFELGMSPRQRKGLGVSTFGPQSRVLTWKVMEPS